METPSTETQYAIPPALPAILKGFARETLRAQPQDIYKFAAQYFKELHATSSQQTQPGFVGDETANLQANLLQHFLDEDRGNIGLLNRVDLRKALCSRDLAFSSRQVQVAIANCDEDPEGLIDYRTVSYQLAKLISQTKVSDAPSAQPTMLRGQTSSELEAAFMQACQRADPRDTRAISRQDFKDCMQSSELALCRKDVNLLLGQTQSGQDKVDYQTLAPRVFELLAARLEDELMLNEHLASSKALSNHLLQILKKQDAQQAGTLPLALLVATLQSLSQDCLGLNNLTLACIVGHACSQVGEPVKYEAWVPAAAAMMYSMLDFSTASVCHAAVGEFRGKDESQKGRSAGVEGVQDCLQQAFNDADKASSGKLSKHTCLQAISSPATDALHLSPQESMGLRAAIEGNAQGSITSQHFEELCSRLLTQMELEEYVFSYMQAHT